MPTGVYIRTDEHKEKISKSLIGRFTGSEHHNWKGGVIPLYRRLTHCSKHRKWRTKVFERDNYTCVLCGYISNRMKPLDIHADHIKPVHLYLELNYDINNGRTLCIPCHRKTDTWGKH